MTLPQPYFERDGITIFHARCEDIIPHVSPSSVDLLLTDPPYGISYVERVTKTPSGTDTPDKNGIGTWRSWDRIADDDLPFDPSPLLHFRKIILFGANNYASRLPDSGAWLVWDKRNGATLDNSSDAELVWTNIPGVIRMYRQCWRGFSRENDSLEPVVHVHPTQKPVNLMIWLLERYTKPNDLVFDPYMGSGPLAKACQLLGRRYIGVEIEKTYVLAAVKRLQQSVMKLDVA